MTLEQENAWKISFLNNDKTRELNFFTQEWKWDNEKKNLIARIPTVTVSGLGESIISISREKIKCLEEFESIDIIPRRFLIKESSIQV